MNLHQTVKPIYRMEIEKNLDDKQAAGEVLDLLYGNYNDDYQTSYKIVVYDYDHKRNWRQRLNMFWVMPLTLILSPFMYLYSGQVGWSDKSKLGKFILKITGHLND